MDDNKQDTTTPVVNSDTTQPTTPVVDNTTPVVTKVNENGGQEPEITEKDDKKFNYVKDRVDRAKEQTTSSILKELGVSNLDDAKQKIANGNKALEEIEKLKSKIEAQEKAQELSNKKQLISKILDNEKVFDTEALINYLDLDKVQVENGEVKDAENIIASLKKAKPNFFGTFQTTSDNYIKGQQAQQQTAIDKQKAGNTVGAINDYLKAILK